jgi:hypothetical protein
MSDAVVQSARSLGIVLWMKAGRGDMAKGYWELQRSRYKSTCILFGLKWPEYGSIARECILFHWCTMTNSAQWTGRRILINHRNSGNSFNWLLPWITSRQMICVEDSGTTHCSCKHNSRHVKLWIKETHKLNKTKQSTQLATIVNLENTKSKTVLTFRYVRPWYLTAI